MGILKDMMEGSRIQVNEKPQVRITITELIIKEDTSTSFSPSKFFFKGLRARCKVELTGTNVQIVQELGSETALKIMEKVSIGQKLSLTRKEASEVFGTLQSQATEASSPKKTSLIEVRERGPPAVDRIGTGKGEWDRGQQTKVFDISASFNMSREMGEEEVTVNVHQIELTTTTTRSRSMLMSESLNRYVSDALSQKASAVLAEKAIAASGSAAPPPKLK
jgi:hypothetical protein